MPCHSGAYTVDMPHMHAALLAMILVYASWRMSSLEYPIQSGRYTSGVPEAQYRQEISRQASG